MSRHTATTDLRVPPVGERSWWLSEALAADPGAPCPALAGDTAADVCIVGGGFAGLWTAYELTERAPELGLVLLEADVCGAGGSGANGGFFSCSWHMLASLCHFFGEDAGVRYAELLADQVGELGDWVARHDAAIDFHHEGILYARAGDWQPEPDADGQAILARHGLADRLRPVDAAGARRVADSPQCRGGVFTPDLATVQPAKLARELRRVLLERGVRIHEGTPMRELRAGHPAEVVTPGGRVRAGHVVVTTGAWAAADRHWRRAFAVAVDYMVVTEAIPERLAEIGWTTHTGIADSREMILYLRRTDDDRIAIGGGGLGLVYGSRIGGRALTSQRLAEVAAGELFWLFPQLEGVRFDAAWSGPMDIARPGVPFFYTAPSGNLHAGLGFSGHGLTPTKVGGKTLTSLVLGADDEWAELPVVGPPLTQVPPEPLRWPMVQSMSWLMETGDRRQEHGRPRGVARRAAGRVFDAYCAARPRDRRRR
ncbi:MAG TPA: FAD-binding oxidoreductase [Thermoleophilia bacterium]|nr:FAD-binding oxidoreductase [Thermoleophilia bacterium]